MSKLNIKPKKVKHSKRSKLNFQAWMIINPSRLWTFVCLLETGPQIVLEPVILLPQLPGSSGYSNVVQHPGSLTYCRTWFLTEISYEQLMFLIEQTEGGSSRSGKGPVTVPLPVLPSSPGGQVPFHGFRLTPFVSHVTLCRNIQSWEINVLDKVFHLIDW